MSLMQIVLLILGGFLFVVSFILPGGEKQEKTEEEKFDGKAIKEMAQETLDNVAGKLSEMVEETVDYTVEKSERSMERISNEKIMAISEYSETVMADMEKAHKEIIFLYDMLNDKTAALNNTIREADAMRQNMDKVIFEVNHREISPVQESVQPILDEAIEEEIPVDTMDKLVSETEKLVERENAVMPDIYGAGAMGNKNERILALHNEGKSNVAIAKDLGLGVGEVKLVIDLFKGAK